MSADSEKQVKKEAGLSLTDELSALKQEMSESDSGENKEDVSADMMEVKRRLNKSEVELKAMSDAMKSTLIDLRSMMQDFDNPFNMLRTMGVDKLVNNAVEQVEDELHKAKREESKKRMAEEPKEHDRILTVNNPAYLAPVASPAQEASYPPAGLGSPQTRVAQAGAAVDAPVGFTAFPTPEVGYGPQQQTGYIHGQANQLAGQGAPGSLQFLPYEVTQIKERMGRNENVLKELTMTLSSLIEDMKEVVASNQRKTDEDDEAVYDIQGLQKHATARRGDVDPELLEDPGESAYYEAYVSLIGEYLLLRFGQSAAQQILLEGLYKGWASPKVVRDIIDVVRSKKKIDEPEPAFDFTGNAVNSVRIEDKLMITTLLKNLDKPMNPRDEPTQLFMLLALVQKARESVPGRA